MDKDPHSLEPLAKSMVLMIRRLLSGIPIRQVSSHTIEGEQFYNISWDQRKMNLMVFSLPESKKDHGITKGLRRTSRELVGSCLPLIQLYQTSASETVEGWGKFKDGCLCPLLLHLQKRNAPWCGCNFHGAEEEDLGTQGKSRQEPKAGARQGRHVVLVAFRCSNGRIYT
jgi:hypothetical protein